MSDIFREVDEEVRREQFTALWKRFGPFIIGLAVLIVVGVGGWRAWEWYEAREAARAGALYFDAVELATDGQHEQASEAFAELARSGDAYAALAALQHAAALASAGDTEAAVAAYDVVAEDASVSRLLRGLANIRAGYLLVDTADPAALNDRLAPYLGDEQSPWRNAALEIQGLAAYRTGDYEAASSAFEQILADPQAPGSLLQRAEMMFTLLAAGAPNAITAAEPAETPATPAASGLPQVPQVAPTVDVPAAPEGFDVPAAAPEAAETAAPAELAPTAPAAEPQAVAPAAQSESTAPTEPVPSAQPATEPAPQPAVPATEASEPAAETVPTDETLPAAPPAEGTNGDTR